MRLFKKSGKRKVILFSPETLFPLSFTKSSQLLPLKKPAVLNFDLTLEMPIKSFSLSLECKVADTVKYGTHHIVIGIDFGTSSSKLIIRDDSGDNNPKIIFPEEKSNDFPVFAFPTSISIKDGRVFFGKNIHKTSLTFSALKVCLMCSEPDKCENCPFGQGVLSKGRILQNFDPDLPEIEVKEVVTIFLAFLISSAKMNVREDLIVKKIIPKFFYHLGAPLDKIDSKEKMQFEECLFLARNMASRQKIINGVSLKRIHAIHLKLKEESPILPDKEERDFFVLPETYAAIMSYLDSPKARDGLYAIVDIGASTTDISCFRYSSEHASSYFYHANTYETGCNDIDQLTLDELKIPSANEDILSKFRKARHLLNKETTQKKIRIFNDIDINQCDIQKASKTIGKRIRKHFLETLGKAYKKEQKEWPKLNVFTIGGGSRVPEIMEFLKIPLNRDENWETRTTIFQDTEMDFKKNNPLKMNIEDDDMLWVAAGLSIHLRHWLGYISESEIEPLIPKYIIFDDRERLRQYDG